MIIAYVGHLTFAMGLRMGAAVTPAREEVNEARAQSWQNWRRKHARGAWRKEKRLMRRCEVVALAGKRAIEGRNQVRKNWSRKHALGAWREARSPFRSSARAVCAVSVFGSWQVRKCWQGVGSHGDSVAAARAAVDAGTGSWKERGGVECSTAVRTAVSASHRGRAERGPRRSLGGEVQVRCTVRPARREAIWKGQVGVWVGLRKLAEKRKQGRNGKMRSIVGILLGDMRKGGGGEAWRARKAGQAG